MGVKVSNNKHIRRVGQENNMIWYDMINLFNFGLKTVVHIIIKYD